MMPFVNQNTKTICYKTFGDASDQSIVLITGIGGQMISWPDTLIYGLVEAGLQVIVFDNRDAGLSQRYSECSVPSMPELKQILQSGKSFQPPYTFYDMAADVISLLDTLDIEQAHILGASMGGMIAQCVAIRFPERVLSLTCIASSTGEQDLPKPKAEVMATFFSAKPEESTLDSIVEKRLALYKIYNHPEHVDESSVRAYEQKAYARAYYPEGFTRQLIAMICTSSRTEELKQLELPCLVIHGDYDPMFNLVHAERLQRCIAGSELVVVEKMGHGTPECICPDLIKHITNFIERVNHGK